jgi:hypothetical protein
VIAAAGDIACNGTATPNATRCQEAGTASLIAAGPKVSAVLPLGDLQYECGDYPNLLRFYDPTWGRFRGITHPAIGNHEYLTTRGGSGCDPSTTVSGKGYFDYWNGVNAVSGPAGDRTRGYYSYDVGSWHLIALNSNCARVGGCDATSPQGTWLRDDLAAHPGRCTLAYWHHPRFSSGEHGDDLAIAPLWDALYAAGADVVLNGHDHDYERFAKLAPSERFSGRGIREFVVGTGGASHYAFGPPVPGSQVRVANRSGVLRMRLAATSYNWSFIDTSGKTRDSGSTACHR